MDPGQHDEADLEGGIVNVILCWSLSTESLVGKMFSP